MKTEMAALKNEVRNCIRALQKNILNICLFTVIGFLIGSIASLVPVPSMYQASSAISKTTVSLQTGSAIAAYADLLTTSRILNEVANALGPDSPSVAELSGMFSASASESKQILYIRATYADPIIAIKACNAAANEMVGQINEMFTNPDIVLLETATTARLISNHRRTALLYRVGGAVVFAFLCCAFYFIRVLTSKKVLSIEDCTLDNTLDIVGVLPFVNATEKLENEKTDWRRELKNYYRYGKQ